MPGEVTRILRNLPQVREIRVTYHDIEFGHLFSELEKKVKGRSNNASQPSYKVQRSVIF